MGLVAVAILIGLVTGLAQTPPPEPTRGGTPEVTPAEEIPSDSAETVPSAAKRETPEAAVPPVICRLSAYADGFFLVQDYRRVRLVAGRNTLRLKDVPATIVANSVRLEPLDGSNAFNVLAQRYSPGLNLRQDWRKILIGQTVKIQQEEEMLIGTVLRSDAEGLVVQTEEGTIHVYPQGNLILPPNTAKLLAGPYLEWTLEAPQAGEYRAQLTYLATGLEWQANYVAVLREQERNMSLRGWITVHNRTGASFPNAHLTFASRSPADPSLSPETPPVTVTLSSPVALDRGGPQRFALFAAPRIKVRTMYRVESQATDTGPRTPQVRAFISNTTDEGLGQPLLAGTGYVYRLVGEELEWIGRLSLPAVPAEGTIVLDLGLAREVSAEREILEERRVGRRIVERACRVTLRNLRPEDILVQLVEQHAGEWEFLANSHIFMKEPGRVVSEITVPRNSKITVFYRVRETIPAPATL